MLVGDRPLTTMVTSDLDAAVAAIPDGTFVYLGGAVLNRRPVAVCRALAAAGRRELDVMTFAGSLDVDLLVGAGCVSTVRSAYVGLGNKGFAPQFTAASRSGAIEDLEYSEWTMLQGIRAAAYGLPFLPTAAGAGSDVVAALHLRDVVDPYSGDTYLAVPAIRPDVTVLHAWRATAEGDVQFGWPPEHLWDVDVAAARAAKYVIVTVEEIADATDVAASSELTRLFGFEVDLLMHVPGGSWPTACPPVCETDEAAVEAWARSNGDPAALWTETEC